MKATLKVIALAALLLAGCGAGAAVTGEAPTATPTPLPPTDPPPSPTATVEPTAAASATPTIVPTFTPNPDFLFNIPDNRDVVRGGKSYTDPGGVVYHDGLFHMFSNTFDTWPGDTNAINYYTSADGFEWDRQTDEPLQVFADQDYIGMGVMATSALVEDDGTWVLYFYTMESGGSRFLSHSGRATAPSPLGPWTADAEPLLSPGPEGSWDAAQVLVTSVVKGPDGRTYLYYAGAAARGPHQIGLAISDDGVRFTKYNDPATNDALYAASDPVLRAGASQWDARLARQPNVLITPEDGWVMIYRSDGNDHLNNINQYGLAFSTDGITWTPDPRNPIHEPEMFRQGHSLWFNALLYVDGVYYLFFELSKNAVLTTLTYTGTHTGSLR